MGERVTSAGDVIVNSIVHTCYSGFPRESPQLKFRLIIIIIFFFFRSATVCKSLTCMRDDLTLMSTLHGVMADEEKFIRWKISTNTAPNGYQIFTRHFP